MACLRHRFACKRRARVANAPFAGHAAARQVRQERRQRTDALKARGITPGLAVVIVGDNPASRVYVANKVKACSEVGLDSAVYAFTADTPDAVVIDVGINRLSDGRLVGDRSYQDALRHNAVFDGADVKAFILARVKRSKPESKPARPRAQALYPGKAEGKNHN